MIADLDDQVFSSRELMAELRSGGIDRHTALLMGQQDESPDARRQLGLMGLTLAEYFAEQGARRCCSCTSSWSRPTRSSGCARGSRPAASAQRRQHRQRRRAPRCSATYHVLYQSIASCWLSVCISHAASR